MNTDLERMRQAINTTANLMEADDARCIAAYGAPVGISVSMAANLIHEATHGPVPVCQAEWVRRALQSLDAANDWSDRNRALEVQVFGSLFPDGTRSRPLSAAEVRGVAVQLAPASIPQH